MNDLVTPALELHALGYTIIGSGGSKGNNPRISGSGWQHLRYDSNGLMDAIRNSNVTGIGAVTTGIAVIDLDVKHDVNGIDVFYEWLSDNDPDMLAKISSQQCVETPTGGRHYYFRDERHQVTNSGGKMKKLHGVDVRGVGGFICMPPTQRTRAGMYRWQVGPRPLTDLPPAPLWLQGGSGFAEYDGWSPDDTNWGTDQLAAAARAVAQSTPGLRNDTLHLQARAMGHLVCEGHLSVRSAQRVLLLGALDSGMHEGESRATIKSGLVWVLTMRGSTLIEMADSL